MNRQRILDIARSAMADRKTMPTREKGYIFHHGLRTAKIALTLVETVGVPIEVSPDILFAAAVFHDIGKGQEPHNERGADRAEQLLKTECDCHEIAEIAAIIRLHNQRRKAQECSNAVRIHQDADILDHFGAQSIWLAFHWNAATEESPEQSLEFCASEKNKKWVTGARASLNFAISGEIFDRRQAFETNFYHRFRNEIDGCL
ncbi:MAG: HD domain-containing protein [Phycisphaerae bacterium]|jgi:uncharacterized protein